MSEERWHESERLRRLEDQNEKLMLRVSELDKAQFNLRHALLKGPMSSDTDRGYHRLIMTFETIEEMMEARKAIYHAVRRRDP
jgi:hypothetical protein